MIEKHLKTLIAVALLLMLPFYIHAQDHEEQIRAQRAASNAALKALDEMANMEFLTDDVFITTGGGTLIAGKEALIDYIEQAQDMTPMYWVRTPDEIEVNEERGLAWESGVWHGYEADDQEETSAVFSGKYSAMWVLQSGAWKIKSQLFVTLN